MDASRLLYPSVLVVGLAFVPLTNAAFQGSTGSSAGAAQPTAPAAASAGTPIGALPFTIDECGRYYLTKCLVGIPGQNGITIAASDVTLDLNGFTLTGVPGSLDGIHAESPYRSITITNGFVFDWGGDGIETSLSSTVLGCTSTDNDGHGINAPSGCVVRDCTARKNLGNGMVVGGIVSGCRAAQNTGTGIQLVAGVATDCEVSNNDVGMTVNMGSAAHCSAIGGMIGFQGTAGARIQDCTAIFNDVAGIRAQDECTVAGNTCRQNGYTVGGAGILVDDRSIVEGNDVVSNDYGVRVLGTSNLVVRNTAHGNLQNDYDVAAGNSFGPVVNVAGAGDIGSTVGADHPQANFRH